jgi:hypothetical protein
LRCGSDCSIPEWLNMNIVQRLRYPLSGSESSDEIAQRLAVGCSPGMVLSVRGDYFRVLHTRPVMVRRTSADSVNGAPIALVEDPSTPIVRRVATIPPPPVTVEEEPKVEDPVPEVVEAEAVVEETASETQVTPPLLVEVPPLRRSSRPPAPVIPIRVGQAWVPKDTRRNPTPFKLVAVNPDHAVADDGRKIQLQRFSRYRLVNEAS